MGGLQFFNLRKLTNFLGELGWLAPMEGNQAFAEYQFKLFCNLVAADGQLTPGEFAVYRESIKLAGLTPRTSLDGAAEHVSEVLDGGAGDPTPSLRPILTAAVKYDRSAQGIEFSQSADGMTMGRAIVLSVAVFAVDIRRFCGGQADDSQEAVAAELTQRANGLWEELQRTVS